MPVAMRVSGSKLSRDFMYFAKLAVPGTNTLDIKIGVAHV